MGKEIVTFGDIEIEKKTTNFTAVKIRFFGRCRCWESICI